MRVEPINQSNKSHSFVATKSKYPFFLSLSQFSNSYLYGLGLFLIFDFWFLKLNKSFCIFEWKGVFDFDCWILNWVSLNFNNRGQEVFGFYGSQILWKVRGFWQGLFVFVFVFLFFFFFLFMNWVLGEVWITE